MRTTGRSERLLGASWSSWRDRTRSRSVLADSIFDQKVLMLFELTASRKEDPCFDIDWDAAGKVGGPV